MAEGEACIDLFYAMLYWENEDPALGTVHHLMVLCYYLQHPATYSAQGFAQARHLLADFIVHGLSPQEVVRRERRTVDSHERNWPISARPGNEGQPGFPANWTMTAADVILAGRAAYRESVQQWAAAVHEVLTAA